MFCIKKASCDGGKGGGYRGEIVSELEANDAIQSPSFD